MYIKEERQSLLNNIIKFMLDNKEFEGMLQIGSGVNGFLDIYSDIDVMVGCYTSNDLQKAQEKLIDFFNALNACYIRNRKWTNTVLGLSIYFENGLSIDLSFMPTDEIPIRSKEYKILFSKTQNFDDIIANTISLFEKQNNRYGIDNTIHYQFINELRYIEIAVNRCEFIFADISLSKARQLLLYIETVLENKKLHQFKSFNTLDESFLLRLQSTYCHSMDSSELLKAKNNLLELYIETVKKCDFLEFDITLLKLLGCFQ